jgi:hypothetical protein
MSAQGGEPRIEDRKPRRLPILVHRRSLALWSTRYDARYLGHSVAAVASRMRDAIDLAQNGMFDWAILGVNLDGQPSNPVCGYFERTRSTVRVRHWILNKRLGHKVR